MTLQDPAMALHTPPSKPFTVSRDGFSLNAALACAADERRKLERVCRYLLRPPICLERLSIDGDGLVVYQLKRPFSDGTTHVLFEPLDLMAHIHVRHPSGGLRPSKSAILPMGHRSTGRFGAPAKDPSTALSRAVCTQRPTPSPHRAPPTLAHRRPVR